MLALHRAVQVDQLFDSRVVRVAGHRGQFGVTIDHYVGPEIAGGDVEAGPRVAAQVRRFGPVIGSGDPDGLRLRVPPVGHVGQLRPSVFSDSDQHASALRGEQLGKPVLDHAP